LRRIKESTLVKMGIDQSVIDKLKPYIGLADQQALDALKATPLTLTQPEMDAVTQKFKIFAKARFEKLPAIIKTLPNVRKKNVFW
jgi:hypothetical protein